MTRVAGWYDRLVEGLAALGGLMIAGICLLIVYDVIARNLGLQPPASTVALTEYALLYFTMAAAPWLVRNRGHIVVRVVHARLGPRARSIADIAIIVVCIAVCLLVAGIAVVLAAEGWRRGEIEIRSLAMPRMLLFLPLALGFGLMAVEFLRIGLRGESVTSGDTATDGSETL